MRKRNANNGRDTSSNPISTNTIHRIDFIISQNEIVLENFDTCNDIQHIPAIF